jgi:phage terminase large subunit-like protein
LKRLRLQEQEQIWQQTLAKRRPEQIEPKGDWNIWLIKSGRGWGKTWTGAITIIDWARQNAGEYAVVAYKYADARDVCAEGPSGILRLMPKEWLISYNRSLGEIFIRCADGVSVSKIHLIAADNPDTARGLNLSGAWCDEPVKWRYIESWTEGLIPAVRIGDHPRVIVTTTPKNTPLIKMLVKRVNDGDGSFIMTSGSTFENAANLSETALIELRARYEGTRVGRQELYGELLEDIEGALWAQSQLDRDRLDKEPTRLARVVVAVDPAATANEGSDETGIVVAGKDPQGRGYVLADYTTKASPLEWAKRVVDAYDAHDADAVVVEVNNGGDMIPTLLRQVRPSLPIRSVRATRGKQLRAEPIAAMYEQGRISHVGTYEKLEEQMTSWTPDDPKSPDRLDALVWAMTDLMTGSSITGYLGMLAIWCDTCNLPMPKNATTCNSCGGKLETADSDEPHILSNLGA